MSIKQGNNTIAGGVVVDNTPTSGSSNAVSSGGVYTALGGKADIDASNFNATGKSTIAGFAMPSGTYDDLTVGSDSSIYTAPANGCIFWGANGSSSSGYISIWALTPNADSNWRNDATQRLYCVQTKIDNTNGNSMALFLSKGNKFGISYSNVSSSWLFRFVYAQGEAN